MTETTRPASALPDGTPIERLVDGGAMDCGSGLLLLITRAMRRVDPGGVVGVRSEEASVAVDLPIWAELVGHDITAAVNESDTGPWWFAVRRAGASGADAGLQPLSVFSTGDATPVGTRLWIYTNFDCNLACTYCCAESSPKAAARRVTPDLVRSAVAEFQAMGGREVFFTGGEPFMHPDLGELLDAAHGSQRTVLTNAMTFGRGRRRETLEGLDRDVVLQVSLDSATPEVHDAQRGSGSWTKALEGIQLARLLGFRIRVAATLYDEDPVGVSALHARLDDAGVAPEDRVIRPVAAEGYASDGVHVSIDTLAPEPTIASDGAWWHPVAVSNVNLRVADAPLPLAEVFGVIRDTVAAQGAAAAAGREVFRCA